jgi:hypothetical protein
VGARAGSSAAAGSPDEVGGAGGKPQNGGPHEAAGEGGASSSADAGAGGELPTPGASGSAGRSNGGNGGSGGSVPVDIVPPTILSITPVNGATKLTPTTDIIVITFSEPMNKASVQSAFVPSGAAPVPTFSWNASATELTINPNLTYPAATDPAAATTPFKFSVTTLAKDLAGNALAANVNWQFSLLREISQSFRYRGGGNFTDGVRASTFVGAGDTSTDLATRGFLNYDISALPAGIVTFESATINTRLAGITGDPFGLFGNLLIQSVSYSSVDQAAFDAPPLHDLGVFVAATGSNAVGDVVSKDVLVALKDDYANRTARDNASQYKLLFPGSPNANSIADFAYVSTGNPSDALLVKYLFP